MLQISCVVCGKEIRVSRRGRKRFCSAACRSLQWRSGKVSDPCYYCGCPSTSIDHVPPQNSRREIFLQNLQSKYPFSEVRSCRECNSLLGARGLWTLPSRKKFIRRTLRLRYKKLLKMPDWEPEQLDELGETLRSQVQAGIIMKKILLARLRW